MLREFRSFILRGNVVDLAVGVVIGTAFTAVVNALITFLLVAAVLFFLVVKPVNAVMDRFKPDPPPDAETRDCAECLSAIPVAARRCAFCSSAQVPSS